MTNRLAQETSPYLLQHKDNPVDWWPWGPEALQAAKDLDRPILLSIGYSACHWCHVMERESFEDDATARVMNDHFVCIKVDREERPDLDAVYMEAVQTMTGQGGWPMTVFLTPDGIPFYGGTYFPPEDRYGMPSFTKLLTAIAELWRDRRDQAVEQGTRLLGHIGGFASLAPSNDPISGSLLEDAARSFTMTFDAEWGGFGDAPKFPQPMTLDLLMRLAHRGVAEVDGMVERTLDAMAAGGIFDQIAGGFARYSVDREWVVPHFEKMLYDNAQLLRSYARSYQGTGKEQHRRVAEATATWMLTEMRDPSGGFWSALDADSEGVEGKFYVWDFDELTEVTGKDAEVAAAHWGATRGGNFEGKNILVYAREPEDQQAIERARAKLLERRATRIRPGTDDKVLTAWNGLAASCLAEAGSILDRPGWIEAAAAAMDHVLTEMRVDDRLMRSYRMVDGRADVRHLAFAEDYAFVLEACLTLYSTTTEHRWLQEARWAADAAIKLFLDELRGGFLTTGTDAEQLVTRSKDLIDNAVPAANSVFALELQKLSLITSDGTYEQHAIGIMRLMKNAMERSPGAFGHLLSAVDLYLGDPLEIVIIGDPAGPDTQAMRDAVRTTYVPHKVVIVTEAGGVDLPLVRDRAMVDGRATTYICHRGVCNAPLTDPASVATALRG